MVGGQLPRIGRRPPVRISPIRISARSRKSPWYTVASFRETVQTRLTEQRDDTERLAARADCTARANPAAAAAENIRCAAAETANASLPGADALPPKAAPPAAAGEPAAGTVTIAGTPSGLEEGPPIPDAPPPPPTFEGVPAQPPPTPPPPLPAHTPLKLAGNTVLFAPGDATLDPSQTETLKDVAERRAHGRIAIEGHGETKADSPAAQADALSLGLRRAQAIATKLSALHVPMDKIPAQRHRLRSRRVRASDTVRGDRLRER